jgi:DNA-directed RNA polymerase specialized sigma24 family protein
MATTGDDPRCIGHDPETFRAFYLRHIEDVQRFVARRVADPHLAADLTADVFVAAIESGHSYRPTRGKPIAWLFGVARNVVTGERRRDKREGRAIGACPAATCSTGKTWSACTNGSTRPRRRDGCTARSTNYPPPSGRCSNSLRSTVSARPRPRAPLAYTR